MVWMKAAAAAIALAAPAGASAQSPWSAMATQDLRAIQQLLKENHPGAVDPVRTHFADWLQRGFTQAQQQAASASDYGDYARAIRLYVNGFRDSHTAVDFTMSANAVEWPGLILRRADDGKLRVAVADNAATVKAGDELLSCDGVAAERLLETTVYPYFVNADLPHTRDAQVYRLFFKGGTDPDRVRNCQFRSASGIARVELNWRRVGDDYFTRLSEAYAGAPNEMGVSIVDGVTFIGVPTFDAGSKEGIAKLDALVTEIKAKAPQLRSGGPIVIDVRGNGGGDSSWAGRIATALWGEPLVEWVAAPFDWTHEWRASPANLERVRNNVAWAKANGQSSTYSENAAAAIEAALKAGQPYARTEFPVRTRDASPPPNPVSAEVYFLTDEGCGSSCLDFADLVLRMPGVTHIGRPTYADAAYIDVGKPARLPSGLADLRWSLKVYRNRIRDHNQFYQPKLRWPGGAMARDKVAAWVKTL